MAKGIFPLLVLFLSVSYVAARSVRNASDGNLEALCKKTLDEKFCSSLLMPLVTPTTSFSSMKWNRAVLSKAMTRARTARDFMVNQGNGFDAGQHIALKDCLDKLDTSVELLRQASREYVEVYKFYGTEDFQWHKKNVRTIMDTAATDQKACYDSLNGRADEIMVQVREQANRAYMANRVAADIVLDV